MIQNYLCCSPFTLYSSFVQHSSFCPLLHSSPQFPFHINSAPQRFKLQMTLLQSLVCLCFDCLIQKMVVHYWYSFQTFKKSLLPSCLFFLCLRLSFIIPRLYQAVLTFSDPKLSSQSPVPPLHLLLLLMSLLLCPHLLSPNLTPLSQSQVINIKNCSSFYFWPPKASSSVFLSYFCIFSAFISQHCSTVSSHHHLF